MLKLPPFNILRPRNREELRAAFNNCKDGYRILSGGTDLINGLKKRLYPETTLISLKRVASLNEISYDCSQDQLFIGAMTTLKQVAAAPEIKELQPALAAAIRLIAAPPIRNRATIGGNLCLDNRCYYYNQSQSWRQLAPVCFKCGGRVCNAAPGAKKCQAVFSADLPPLLIALEAEITIDGKEGPRTLPLADFYTGSGSRPNLLGKDEYVVGVTLSKLKTKNSIYRKFRLRRALDFPLAGVALAFSNNSEGKFKDIKLIISAIASGPLNLSEAAAKLEGRSLGDEAAVQAAVEIAMAAARPIANAGSKPFHRKKMIGLLLKKMTDELAAGQEA